MFKPITRQQILDSSKLKEFADNNFKFDENGRKLSKQVENTMGKGEIARYEQFLLFPQSFQKVCFPGASKGVIVWEWDKPSKGSYNLTLYQTPNFGLAQIQSICRQQNKCNPKNEICFGNGRKHCG